MSIMRKIITNAKIKGESTTLCHLHSWTGIAKTKQYVGRPKSQIAEKSTTLKTDKIKISMGY